MRTYVTIEPFQFSGNFDFLDFSQFRENFQVPVNRPQADVRQTYPHHFINLIRAGMGLDRAKLLQDDLPLTRHA